MDIKEYMLIAFAVCCMLTLIALVRAPSPTERAERVAFSLICIAALAAPTASVISGLGGILTLPEGAPTDRADPLYREAAAEAFAEGVRKAVCEAFSVDASAVQVEVRGFSLETVRAESITVLLSSGAKHVDHKAVARFIEKEGWGMCDVRREAG